MLTQIVKKISQGIFLIFLQVILVSVGRFKV